MMDPLRGLKGLQAILDAQKSRGWAHNEFDYFQPCPTCGHWYDGRSPERPLKHKCTTTARIVVTAISQTMVETIPTPNIAVEMAAPLPAPQAGGTKP